MNIYRPLLSLAGVGALSMAFGGTALAGTGTADVGENTATLTLTATIQTAVSIKIENDGGANISSNAVDLGDVNGQGLGEAAANVTKTTAPDHVDYTTRIKVTPTFTGYTNPTATVSVYQDTQAQTDAAIALEGADAASAVDGVPTTASAANPVASNAASDEAIHRVVGVRVPRDNGGNAVARGVNIDFKYVLTVSDSQ